MATPVRRSKGMNQMATIKVEKKKEEEEEEEEKEDLTAITNPAVVEIEARSRIDYHLKYY